MHILKLFQSLVFDGAPCSQSDRMHHTHPRVCNHLCCSLQSFAFTSVWGLTAAPSNWIFFFFSLSFFSASGIERHGSQPALHLAADLAGFFMMEPVGHGDLHSWLSACRYGHLGVVYTYLTLLACNSCFIHQLATTCGSHQEPQKVLHEPVDAGLLTALSTWRGNSGFMIHNFITVHKSHCLNEFGLVAKSSKRWI